MSTVRRTPNRSWRGSRRTRRWLAVSVVAALGIAACGGSDTDEGAGDDAGSTAEDTTDSGDSADGGSAGADTTADGSTAGTAADGADAEGDSVTAITGDVPEQAAADTITIGVPTLQEQYVDPHFAVGGLLFPLRWAISEGLYRQTLDLEWVPNLATDYEISDDELTWTFTLRDDVTMQDGSHFTANDVKTAVDRIIGSEDFAHLATFRSLVTGATVVDDYTVEVTTSEPYATLLNDMPPPIATDYYNEVGEEKFREQPIAAGAWKFESQELNSSVTYTRFDDYFDKERLPNFETLVYEIVPDESARLAGVQTGQLDMAFGLTPLSAEQLRSSEGVRILESANTAQAYMFPLDMVAPEEESKLHDVRVREALLMAIDRQGIADTLYQGFAEVPAGGAPPTMLGFDDSLEPHPYDPEAAKALLEEAGASDLSLTLNSYNATPSVPEVSKLAETVAGYWTQIGVEVELNITDTATILPAWRDRNLRGMGLLAGPSQYYDEPQRLANSFFSTDASYSTVSDPELDELVGKIESTVDIEERERLGREFSDMLYEELFGLPIILVSSLIAVGSDVATFQPMKGSPYAGPLWSLNAN